MKKRANSSQRLRSLERLSYHGRSVEEANGRTLRLNRAAVQPKRLSQSLIGSFECVSNRYNLIDSIDWIGRPLRSFQPTWKNLSDFRWEKSIRGFFRRSLLGGIHQENRPWAVRECICLSGISGGAKCISISQKRSICQAANFQSELAGRRNNADASQNRQSIGFCNS